MSMLHRCFGGYEWGSIDVSMFNWVSIQFLLNFGAKLLCSFTAPIKGEGGGGVGGERDVPFELLQPSLSFRAEPRVGC